MPTDKTNDEEEVASGWELNPDLEAAAEEEEKALAEEQDAAEQATPQEPDDVVAGPPVDNPWP